MFQHGEEESQKKDYNQGAQAHAKFRQGISRFYAEPLSAVCHHGETHWVYTA